MNIRAPNRVTHTYKQRLHGAMSKVFPLLCPVREAEWIDGWNPIVVLTQSGYAEQDCVFVTMPRCTTRSGSSRATTRRADSSR